MTDSQNYRTLKNIKAISLDIDGTLWDFESAMTNALALTLRRIKQTVLTDEAMQLTVDDMVHIRDTASRQLGGDAKGLERIRHAGFVMTLKSIGHPDPELANELFQLYMEARFSNTKPFPEVPAALIRLDSRFELGVISNGNTHPDRFGLPNSFDFVVFATDCGFAKPDPRIFEFALSKSGHNPEEVLHVGDSLESDVSGANNCGLRSAWLNRDNIRNTTGITPDLEVPDLQHLADLLFTINTND